MLGQVKTINGVKQIVPLTSDTRIGNPLGTILAVYTTRCPSGYLPCDGSTYDTTQYPALYALLGSNHTPDLREVTLKGIGLNSNATDHVSVSGLSVGDYLDDRLQNHTHIVTANNLSIGNDGFAAEGANNPLGGFYTGNVYNGRKGATTEVKAVGVNYVIKATPGLEESQADYVAGIIEDYFDVETITGTGTTAGLGFTAKKSGNVVTVWLTSNSTIASGQDVNFGTLPVGYRPSKDSTFSIYTGGGSTSYQSSTLACVSAKISVQIRVFKCLSTTRILRL